MSDTHRIEEFFESLRRQRVAFDFCPVYGALSTYAVTVGNWSQRVSMHTSFRAAVKRLRMDALDLNPQLELIDPFEP